MMLDLMTVIANDFMAVMINMVIMTLSRLMSESLHGKTEPGLSFFAECSNVKGTDLGKL